MAFPGASRLVLAAALLLAGCGGDPPDGGRPADPRGEITALARRASFHSQAITTLLGRPWAAHVPALERFRSLVGPLQGFLQEAARLAPGAGDEEVARLLEEGREVVGKVMGPPETCLLRLQAIAPVADRAWDLAARLRAAVQAARLPPGTIFMLRNRHEDAWVPAFLEAFRFISEGIEEILRGRDRITRFDIGAANLKRAANEGEELLHAIDDVVRRRSLLASKLARLERLVPWARGVLAEAARAPRGRRPAEDALDAAKAAVGLAAAALEDRKARSLAVGRDLLSGRDGAVEACTSLLEEVDGVRNQLMQALLPLAIRLGLKPPE